MHEITGAARKDDSVPARLPSTHPIRERGTEPEPLAADRRTGVTTREPASICSDPSAARAEASPAHRELPVWSDALTVSRPVATARARLAGLTKHRPDDATTLDTARRDLKAATAEQYIRRLVDTAPPLTSEQRTRLASLLVPADVDQAGGGRRAA